MTVRPVRSAWASESSLSAWRKFGSLATHWADAQADLSLPWAHSHLVGFVMSRLIYTEWASDEGPRDWNYWEAAGLLIAKSYSPFLKKRINCFIRLDFAGSDSSVGSEPAWYSGGCGFDSPVRQHSFAETGHEIISMHSPPTADSKKRVRLQHLQIAGEHIATEHTVWSLVSTVQLQKW